MNSQEPKIKNGSLLLDNLANSESKVNSTHRVHHSTFKMVVFAELVLVYWLK